MVLSIKDMIENSKISIVLRTCDSDVVVILIGFMPQFIELNCNIKLWVDFGTGAHQKYISIDDVYEYLGDSISLGFMFFHAFTGCASTSSFYKKSKTNWLIAWMS